MKSFGVDVRSIVTIATAGTILSFGLIWALSALSEPQDASGRLGQVQAKLDRAQRAAAAGRDIPRFAEHAICPDIGIGENAAKSLIDRAAAQARVSLGEARLSRGGQGPAPLLAVFNVDVSAKGPEPALRNFLAGLNQAEPLILADSVDLTSDGLDVTLKLKGRLLCHDRPLT